MNVTKNQGLFVLAFIGMILFALVLYTHLHP